MLDYPSMESFRYPQFCALARAAEVIGHRWVLPILRELFIGPQRFSDLLRRMGGISTSVLAQRLTDLEQQGVITRRKLPAPAASTVYELTARGRALEPILHQLSRWATPMLTAPLPGDHVEPDWLQLATKIFARTDATPPLSFELLVTGAGPDAEVRGHGGAGGTCFDLADDAPVDLHVRAPAVELLGYLSGAISAEVFANHPDVGVEGEATRLAELPQLFDVPLEDPVF